MIVEMGMTSLGWISTLVMTGVGILFLLLIEVSRLRELKEKQLRRSK